MSDGSRRDHWIGFDLGGTKMLAQVYDADLKPIGRERKRTKASAGIDSGLDRIVESIRDAVEDAGIDPGRLAGIGIGCPGPVDMEGGLLLNPPNLGWSRVPIGERLAEEFSVPVRVLNDVDAGLYAEYRYGAAKDTRCAIGVFPGTGIGGGCIYKGEILHGSHCTCMEIGHIQIMPEGPLCGCGRRGCLEAVASRLAIAANAAKAAYRGEAPHLNDAAGTDISSIRSGVLSAAIEADDKTVRDIVREAARHIGIAVAGVIHILSPDVVVLGGGLVEAMPDLFIDQVSRSARKRVMSAFKDTFEVVRSQLEDDAVTKGAAAWAQHKIPQPDATVADAVGV
ncbi:MAG: ROK family protein [Planctomycetota bacterium]|nr:MAG: ROK family protein [Planctomycetota bacterium]REJ95546.1 MAG: ROK family protein [Planctomycetota bacterium]REK21932.1 MAG: ROK family protein [Planctomycetota bacterium]REK32156.1 MAG: ROK family protein [Planctomycetota bacterium]